MKRISNEEKEKILQEVAKEFPNDPAMQQVHAAQLIIARLAELEGISVFEYIRRNNTFPNNEQDKISESSNT